VVFPLTNPLAPAGYHIAILKVGMDILT